MNAYQYRVAWCPVCEQGWVEIVKDKSASKLFVCCEECETEWSDPSEVQKKGTATHDKYGQSVVPTHEEIMQMNWGKYIQQK